MWIIALLIIALVIITLLIITVIMIALNFFVVKKSEEGVNDSIIKKEEIIEE